MLLFASIALLGLGVEIWRWLRVVLFAAEGFLVVSRRCRVQSLPFGLVPMTTIGSMKGFAVSCHALDVRPVLQSLDLQVCGLYGPAEVIGLLYSHFVLFLRFFVQVLVSGQTFSPLSALVEVLQKLSKQLPAGRLVDEHGHDFGHAVGQVEQLISTLVHELAHGNEFLAVHGRLA